MNPKTYKKLVAKKPSRDFRNAVEIVEVDFPIPAPNEIVVRNLYAGVNASDINIAAGIYFVNTRLVIVGYVSEYTSSELERVNNPRIYEKLLWKSASLRGFLFVHYLESYQEKLSRLMKLVSTGTIQSAVDSTEFRGIESIVDAVEYLYSGKNCGKVVVRF